MASICVCFCWAAVIDSLRLCWISPVWMSLVMVCLICSVSCMSVGGVLVLVDGCVGLFLGMVLYGLTMGCDVCLGFGGVTGNVAIIGVGFVCCLVRGGGLVD